MKALLKISYDGRNYHGWQVQAGHTTVQQTLQNAVQRVFGQRYPVTGCSRTDAGVHAKEYYCTVEGKLCVPIQKIPAALNSSLPEDIAVIEAMAVEPEFHPRYSCIEKEYVYDICTAPVREPLSYGRSWQLCRSLDLSAINEAARYLCGTHDFKAFCASGSSVDDTCRTISYIGAQQAGEHVILTVRANGFLYHMVRIIAGTLAAVGTGKTAPEQLRDMIDSKDRRCAGITAPAYGLYLNRVFYQL